MGNQGGYVENQGGNVGIQLLGRYLTRILLDRISLVIFLKLKKANLEEHLSAAASEGCNCSFFVDFNNVSQTFHLSNFNSISQKFSQTTDQ